jgi:hypothetical protein
MHLECSEQNSTVPKVALYKVDKILPDPHTQRPVTGKAVSAIVLNSVKFLLYCSPRVSSRGSLKEVLNKEKTVSF